MRNELRLSVQDAIAKQKPKFQVILLASVFNELSLDQAAGALGITPAPRSRSSLVSGKGSRTRCAGAWDYHLRDWDGLERIEPAYALIHHASGCSRSQSVRQACSGRAGAG